MAIEVRAVRFDDAAQIAEIYRPVVEDTIISFEELAPDTGAMHDRIATVTSAYPWLVACDGDEVSGYAYASRHRERAGYRYSVDVSVYVAQKARGTGVGTALYGKLFEILEAREFHRAFAGIALPNPASVALHRRFGFTDVGVYREVGYKFGRWFDVLWLQRAL